MYKNFEYKNSNISYEVLGDGQPVVLLHGFGESGSIWNKQDEVLQKHCKLIIPDIPGSGNSAMLQGDNISMEDYADCINALLDEEKIETCIMLGHSMGGYITLAYAEKYANRLKAFGLVHSTAFADSEEKKANRKKGIELIQQYGGFSFLKNTTPNLFADTFKKEHPDEVATLIEEGKSFRDEALIQYYVAMMNRLDKTEVLKQSKVPVLFIVGTEDVAAPLSDLLQQVHLPNESHFHLIEGVGHMSMLEAPEQLNKYLLDFINTISC
jgi:pimeloyl-ACP methyl ester carboxylesterase